MRISVKAKPQSREDKVERLADGTYAVFVREPPIQGRANRAIIALLSEFFGVSSDRIRIVSGHTSRNKIIEMEPHC